RRLTIVFAMTGIFLVAEIVGGFVTGSLALLADAGHMLTDVAALGLALFAIKLAERPATAARTYGYYRVEILAAFVNAIALIGISAYILYEATNRIANPPNVHTLGMLVVASLGLFVNLSGLALLYQGSNESLNIKGAYLELVADTLSSIGTILAAVVMITTGWLYADAAISIAIGLFILPRTWVLLRDAIGILLEGTPAHVNLGSLREAIEKLEGVAGVHDLHVWTLTSGVYAMSAHVVLSGEGMHHDVLCAVQKRVSSDFSIAHVTVQIELPGFAEEEMHL
ncbi:MAG TPA: cation diffusion facilitator family transporter, partial [Thermoanaerobaculia bacterium]